MCNCLLPKHPHMLFACLRLLDQGHLGVLSRVLRRADRVPGGRAHIVAHSAQLEHLLIGKPNRSIVTIYGQEKEGSEPFAEGSRGSLHG